MKLLNALRAALVALCLASPALAGPPAIPPSAPVSASTLKVPSVYTGQVATNSRVPFFSTPGQIMTRSVHIARQNITSLQIVVPNFKAVAQTGDVLMTGTTSVTASIEYPVGTITRVKFSGSNTGTVNGAALLTSDATSVTIPSGAQFFVRMWLSNAAGLPYYAYATSVGSIEGFVSSGTTTPDLTGGGAVTASGINGLSPIAIIAKTSAPSVCIVGDSRAFGQQDVRNDYTYDGGEIARAIGANFGYINLSIPSDTAWVWSTPAWVQYRSQVAPYCSALIRESGINDLFTHGPAAVVADIVNLESYFAGKKIFGTTLPPEASSTNSFVDQVNQTTNSTVNANRLTFNGLVIAGIASEQNYIDINAVIDPTGSNKWPVNGTANYYTSDGVHESTPAAVAIAKSGVFNLNLFSR